MKIVRIVAAVVVGYVIFAVCAVMLFQLGHIDPHADAEAGTRLIVIAGGAVIALIAGLAAKFIAPNGSLAANYALFIVISSFAAVSLVSSGGSHYTQYAAIFLFGPISLLGGMLRRKMER